MGIFLYVSAFFGTTGVLSRLKRKKKEKKTAINSSELASLKVDFLRFYKSRNIQMANNAYLLYIDALERSVEMGDHTLSDELHSVKLEYSLYKKRNNIVNPPEIEVEEDKEVTPELRKISKILAKEAELYYESDPNTSLDLLNSAACFNPDKSFQPTVKIAQINYNMGKHQEAFATYQKILQTLDRSDIKDFHVKSLDICEKINIKLFKDAKYDEYIYYYCRWLFHYVLLLAINGKVNELNTLLSSTDKMTYGVPTKINTCLTRLGKVSKRIAINESLNLFFNKQSNQLKEIAQCITRSVSRGTNVQAMLLAKDLTPENFEFYYQNCIKLNLDC